VESLPKMDNSITFHECIVICDVLRPNCRPISDFLAFLIFFLKVGKFAVFSERLKARSVSASMGQPLYFPDQGLCPWTPLGALSPDLHYRSLTLVFGEPPTF